MNIDELNTLKTRIEKAKIEKSRAEGAISQIIQAWEKDFGVKSEKELQDLIQKTDEQIKALEAKYNEYIKEIKVVLDTK